MGMMVDRGTVRAQAVEGDSRLSPCTGVPVAAVTPLSGPIEAVRYAALKNSERKEPLCYLAPRARRRS